MLLTIWISAFIPATVPGYTRTIAAGLHTGKTAVPLPTIARLGNTFKTFDCGYLTDQRTFNSSPSASRRMQSMAEILLRAPTDQSGEMVVMSANAQPPSARTSLYKQSHTSSGTTEVNIVSGAVTGYAMADMSRCRFHGFELSGSDMIARISVVGKAGDPLVRGAADIDYEGTFTITMQLLRAGRGRVLVSFNGMIDAFPAFECYADFRGQTKTLFTAPPPPGNTVVDLLGFANRPISGSVTF